MTDELRGRIVELFMTGNDINEISFDTGATRADVRAVISSATSQSMSVCRAMQKRVENTLYAKHMMNRYGKMEA